MVFLESVLPFLGILIGLVLLHEMGHFVVAKMAGVRVEEFGVGMPPRAWGKRFGETIYSVNWLPLGGFVRLTGEESSRIFVEQVNAAGASERAGVLPGDVITEVNGAAVHTAEQLAAHLMHAADHTMNGLIPITIQREEPGERGPELFDYDISLPVPPPDPENLAGEGRLESAAAMIGRVAGVQVAPDPRSLGSKPRWIRIAVLAAGAGVNAVLPILLFAIAAMIPQSVAAGPAVITSVVQGGPAAEAGLQAGDRIVQINNDQIANAGDVSIAINLHLGDDLRFVVERDPEVTDETAPNSAVAETETIEAIVQARLAPDPLHYITLAGDTVLNVTERLGVTVGQVLAAAGFDEDTQLVPGRTLTFPRGETYETQPGDTAESVGERFDLSAGTILATINPALEPGMELVIGQGPTGITIANGTVEIVKEHHGLFSAVGTGWDRTIETLQLTRNRIRSWIAGGEGIRFTGPIGIAQTTGEVVEEAGWLRLIELAALLSLNLAIINILPLPMLDGGRIVFVLLEIVRRGKRISPEKEGLVHLAGFVLLISTVLIISYFDIVRVVTGESALR